jgi:hypothetical protein
MRRGIWVGSRKATRLLGIEGLTVVHVVVDGTGGRVVHAVTADDVVPGCPKWRVVSTARKGRVVTFPRDVPYGERVVRLVWHKRRWRCQEPLCPQGSLTESISRTPDVARIIAWLSTSPSEVVHRLARLPDQHRPRSKASFALVSRSLRRPAAPHQF